MRPLASTTHLPYSVPRLKLRPWHLKSTGGGIDAEVFRRERRVQHHIAACFASRRGEGFGKWTEGEAGKNGADGARDFNSTVPLDLSSNAHCVPRKPRFYARESSYLDLIRRIAHISVRTMDDKRNISIPRIDSPSREKFFQPLHCAFIVD